MEELTATPLPDTTRSTPGGIRRILVAVACTLVAAVLISLAVVARQPPSGTSVELDASWVASLPYQWSRGLVSGRDFAYTYGPASQMLSALAVRLHVNDDPLSSVGLVYLVFTLSGVVLLAVSILMVPKLDGFKSTVAMATLWLLGVPLSFSSFRPLSVVIVVGLATVALVVSRERNRVLWAVLAGVACFTAQLVTGELLVYGSVGVLGFLVLDTILHEVVRRYRPHGETVPATRRAVVVAGVFLAALAGANLVLEIVFQLTAREPYRAFQYLRSILQMIGGYAATMSVGWSLDRARSLAVFAVIGWTAGVVLWRRIVRGEPRDRLFLGWLCVAALLLKSSLVRSDFGHIALGLTPAMVLIVVAHLSWAETRRWIAACVATIAVLVTVWPTADLRGWRVGFGILASSEHPRAAWSTLRTTRVDWRRVLPPGMFGWPRGGGPPAAVVPYQNQLAMAARRPLVSPILQAYAAHTLQQQRSFVSGLDAAASDTEVIWGLDDLASIRLDNVQTIARLPVIFEYVVTHFTDSGAFDEHAGGYLLLERAAHERRLQRTVLRGSWTTDSAARGRFSPDQRERCGLTALELTAEFPIWTTLLQPAEIWVRFLDGEEEVRISRVLPIDGARSWETFVSVFPPEDLSGVFRGESPPDATWTAVEVFPVRGRFGVNPSLLEVGRVSCVELDRADSSDHGTEADH